MLRTIDFIISYFLFRQSLKLEPEDKIMCTSHTFFTIRHVIDECVTRQNADVLCLEIPKKIEDEEQVGRIILANVKLSHQYCWFYVKSEVLFL